jgi:hypothetical protein
MRADADEMATDFPFEARAHSFAHLGWDGELQSLPASAADDGCRNHVMRCLLERPRQSQHFSWASSWRGFYGQKASSTYG